MKQVAVIGGGASGMAAALAAAESGAAVTLLERQARLGRKLAVTGNGRCNLSNEFCGEGCYHGAPGTFLRPALAACGVEETLRRFREMGLVTVTEPNGRVYPLSDTAGSVVDVLRFSLDAAGVRQRLGFEVQSLRRQGSGFLLTGGEGSLYADRVIVACGGAAGGKLGGGNSGYGLLAAFGHQITALRPALVQLRTAGTFCRGLKGVRADAAVAVLRGERTVAESAGEVQFTEYGLSGPAIFEISRAALEGPDTWVQLDLMRTLEVAALSTLLLHRAETRPGLTLDDLFTGTVHNRLGRMLLKYAGYAGSAPVSSLTRLDAEKLARAAKGVTLQITGDLGFDSAQVTAGGADTGAFYADTLESRLCPGLYACGEVLDVDGDCGGYNLQWAWSSGFLAGKSAAGED